jgi:hypothetical protein
VSTNWWNVAGLALDIVGVFGVAFVPGRWGIAMFGSAFELPPVPRFLHRASWCAIATGFVLQLIGQFR